MLVLFTDFGLAGPYTGQMKSVLAREAPGIPVIDLFADAPSRNPRASAYLLAAYAAWFPAGTVFLCVVDPGVGGARAALALDADGRWFVGPDNGLFELVRRRSKVARVFEITEEPADLSASFHGRDLFAPAAARLARGGKPQMVERDPSFGRHADWSDDLAEIVYIDHYGNAMTGLRASDVPADATLLARGTRITRARTFSDMPAGTPLWYENSNGLVEIAVNLGRADKVLGLRIGMPVEVTTQA
jgi:S-adenosyl-L-methionine hydrolase (adenosine-forming)